MAAWRIVRLNRSHNRRDFDCGQTVLNDWLKNRAGQWDKKDLARTYVAVSDAESNVAGYYALSNHRVSFESLPKSQARGLPQIDVPVVLLGRLAVDRNVQGQRLGELLLIDALRRSQHVANTIGIRAVEVDAIDDAAKRFYLKYGFTALTDDDRHLFLPMSVIRKLNLPPL
ncbi:hypothetical protein Pan258_06870 [Symmachiella dynata]|uniref:GNAT family N-acetyltransferase n=1 Tax=Symmachiella dynata TaxID=2527995 RepID=UPI00118A7CCB|nr:GNAT family N-acetyltransferase [Symmachiella dynata]QDT46668.1 hypothetical protein Pan258_06870 [Symmachiella dynata]